MRISRRSALASAIILPAAAGTVFAQSRGGSREKSEISITTADGKRIITANGLPDHASGDFPNDHNPNPLRAQKHHFEMPVKPVVLDKSMALSLGTFGIAVNGVPFNPGGPFWNADGYSGWQFEVLHPANSVALGIDVNHAHTQGRGGMYHYHGLPIGLLWELAVANPTRVMQLIGYAADGFPIYGPDGPTDASDPRSKPRRLRSSYHLRTGKRKDGPKGKFDGRFVEDFEFDPKWGDLDECNGRTGPTLEYPDGTYYYVVTDEFPFVPRFYRGKPDESFRHGPPPGVSPPVPPELKKYEGKD